MGSAREVAPREVLETACLPVAAFLFFHVWRAPAFSGVDYLEVSGDAEP